MKWLLYVFAGLGVAAVLGGSVIEIHKLINRRSNAVSASPATDGISDFQQRVDAILAVDESGSGPEMQAYYAATHAEFDGLSLLDAREATFGNMHREAPIFYQEAVARQQRIVNGMKAAAKKPTPGANAAALEARRRGDLLCTAALPDASISAEMRARAIATCAEIDSICGIDAWLGTNESKIFINEELNREQRILDAMNADNERWRALHSGGR